MKLGFVSAILAELSYEEVIDFDAAKAAQYVDYGKKNGVEISSTLTRPNVWWLSRKCGLPEKVRGPQWELPASVSNLSN